MRVLRETGKPRLTRVVNWWHTLFVPRAPCTSLRIANQYRIAFRSVLLPALP